jgi:hypothetical protein
MEHNHNIVNATYLALARFDFRPDAIAPTADIWATYINMCDRDGIIPVGRKSLMYALRRVGVAWGFEPSTVWVEGRAVKAMSGVRLMGADSPQKQRNAYYPPRDPGESVVPYGIPVTIPAGLANAIYPGGADLFTSQLSHVYTRAGVPGLRLKLAEQAYADLHAKGHHGLRDALRVACLSPVQEWDQRVARIEKNNPLKSLTLV